MMARLTVALALLLLTGCGTSSSGCATVAIDWVDFIQVGSTQYFAGLQGTPAIQPGDIGEVVAKVKFRIDGNVCDPGYQAKDGDAAFLDPGTPIYAVKGHPRSELLTAQRDGAWVAYQAKSP